MKRIAVFTLVLCAMVAASTTVAQIHVDPLGDGRSMLFAVVVHSSALGNGQVRFFVRPAAGQPDPKIDASTCPPQSLWPDQPFVQPLPSMTYLMSAQYSDGCPSPAYADWKEMWLEPLPVPPGDTRRTYLAKLKQGQGEQAIATITIIMEDGGGWPASSKVIQGGAGQPTIIQNFYNNCCDCKDQKPIKQQIKGR